MVHVMSEFRFAANEKNNTGNILNKINSTLIEKSIMGMFVTLFYLVIDTVNMKIYYSSAGHLPPLYYSSLDNKYEYMDKAQNPPLGINPQINYKYAEIL